MITLNGNQIEPTIFPDKTSQVWQLPEEWLKSDNPHEIRWEFENEREIIDIAALSMLIKTDVNLFMPFLPYSRQDKPIHNNNAFNLAVFARIINSMNFTKVTTLDAHNPDRCAELFQNFQNINPEKYHQKILARIKPDYVIFPDFGAFRRYPVMMGERTIFFKKDRDHETGAIKSLSCDQIAELRGMNSALIVDDICDGGATFIEIAKQVKQESPMIKLHLFVTHGIFSRGKEHLLKNGIDFIHTTNSIKQHTEMEIYPV